MNTAEKHIQERVYEIVRQIPFGKVMTYGQIALLLGKGYTARTVGFLMHAAMTEDVPWQRVINSQGSCSTGKIFLPYNVQRKLLQEEGVIFNSQGRCNLPKYLWKPDEFQQFADPETQMSLFDFM
jgi:methylated-DNA-protein-cysteine methyltransferase related protein